MRVRNLFLRTSPGSKRREHLPRWWRWSCVAVGTLALCSCQNQQVLQKQAKLPPMASSSVAGDGLGQLPPQAQYMPSQYGPSQPMPGMDMVSMYGMRPTQGPPRMNSNVPSANAPNASSVVPVSYNEPGDSEPGDNDYYAPGNGATVTPESVTGLPFDPTIGYGPSMQNPMVPGVPLPQDAFGNWSPPGIARPWPAIEYLRDGGDRYSPATVDSNWNVNGLETEDTIAHYDTTDGLTHVEPSNRVHIYAPRFAAVRSVTSMVENDQITFMDHFRGEQNIVGIENNQLAAGHLQQEQVIQDIGTSHVEGFELRQFQDIYSRAQIAGEFSDRFLPYEDLSIIRQGIFEQKDQVRLAEGVDAAITWTHDTALQVTLNNVTASISENVQAASVVYTVNAGPGPAKLRVVKVASTNYAKPGEVIDFTIRFDNVGAQVIGNVTIVDNLTTRLEYVEGSAQSSLPGDFVTDPNEGESLRLRWEITDPLMQGKGGVIRFQCRVR